jgi:hypothetical protein
MRGAMIAVHDSATQPVPGAFPGGGTFPGVKVLRSGMFAERRSDMSDPRYSNVMNDAHRLGPRDPAELRHLNFEDRGHDSIWAWIASIVAAIVVLTLAYDYNGLISTKARNPAASNGSSNTGLALAPVQ